MQLVITIQENEKSLSRRVYEFWYQNTEHTLYLDRYSEDLRETTRHKFLPIRHYIRLDRQTSNMRLEDIVIDEEIKKLAIEKFIDTLQVKKWGE
jgi:hypothetical protein